MSGNGRRTTRSRTKSATDANGDDPLCNTKPNPKLRKDRNRAHNSVFAFFVIFFLIRRLVNPAEEVQRPRVVTPFPAPKIMDLPQVKCEIFFNFFFLNSGWLVILSVSFIGSITICLWSELNWLWQFQGEHRSPSCLSRNSCQVFCSYSDFFFTTRSLWNELYIGMRE